MRDVRSSAWKLTGLRAAVVAVVAAGLPALATTAPAVAPVAQAATSCPADGCAVTIDATEFPSTSNPTPDPLATFNYAVNLDNTKLPADPLALSTESNSPIVAEGNQDRKTVNLPAGRYLVSVRSLDHKMWGAHFTLPNPDPASTDGSLTVPVELTVESEQHPLPLGKIRVFVFNDNTWTNGAPDTEENGLGGFQVGLEEQTGSAVTVDYNNDPLCGGLCITGNDGFVEINNLGPATYFIDVHPPDRPCNATPSSRWYQTTTIDGGLKLMAPTEEGADGTGAPGEQLWEPPNNRTAYWFGFVCAPRAFTGPAGSGEIVGTARNWVEWAPYTTGTFNDPVADPFVALSDADSDTTVFVGRGDGSGNFDIQNVPAGSYNVSIWDEQLSYIMRFKPVTIAAGQTVDLNDVGDDGSVGVGVSRWFGWLDGHVYKDANGNGRYDVGEQLLANTDMDQRWRDGSIKESTFTDANGYYEYPTAEGGALGRWIINEQGFARFSAYPGPSVHDERDPYNDAKVIPSCDATPPANPCIPVSQGGGLLTNQSILEGHRTTVDWGKRDYPPGTPGQIVGITYFSTTRNEFDARFQAHEDYEPAIPAVTVYLEGLGPDGQPNTADDVVLNKYVTDHWQQPSASQDPQDPTGNTFTQSCNPIKDMNGNDVTSQFSPKIGPNCLEVPLAGANTKDGAFDGGYAFADYCPNGYDMAADDGTCNGGSDPVALVAGTYITHVIMPQDKQDSRDCNGPDLSNPTVSVQKTDGGNVVPGGGQGCLYRPVKEEDVNVDLGNQFAPQIPPPPCTGDDHVIDQRTLVDRSVYFGVAGAHAPLCDKRLVVLTNGQNANADFNMMTNFPTDPNGTNAGDHQTGDVAEPGRIVGQVFNDIYFERNPESPWYGEPRPIGGIPVGVYARVDTVCEGGGTSCGTPNVNQPFDPNKWRLMTTLTTSADGSYEVLLPSTETFNCPIPQGPCPGMYMVTVDDPGTKEHPNKSYNPNLLTATTPAEVWPGLTDQLDTPVDPISGTGCEDPAVDPRPEVLEVTTPVVPDTGSRSVTIYGDFIGTAGPTGDTGGRVLLTDDRTGSVSTLTRANGGITSWTPGSGSTPDTIVISVPVVSAAFPAGPKQLTLQSANANGGVKSVNGITLHVLGGGAVTRTDTVKTISAATTALVPTPAGLVPAISTADIGRTVTAGFANGIPTGTTITGVTPGVAITMSNAATQAGTRTLAIGTTDPAAVMTNNSATVTDPAITSADVGAVVTGAGIRTGLPSMVLSVDTTITAGHPQPTFVMSRTSTPTAGSLGAHALTFTKSYPSSTITNNPAIVFDASVVAGDVGSTVSGPGISGTPTVLSVTPGLSFVMSSPATATSPSVPVTLAQTLPTYNPTVVTVPPPPPVGSNANALQDAINAAPANSLLVLSEGTYNENVLVWKPLKIQGLGAGGIIGSHELQGRDPEDPRFNVKGTIVDGRFFQQNFTGFDAQVSAHGPYVLPSFTSGSPSTVLRGADMTVVAQDTAAFDVDPLPTGQGDSAAFRGARIDGLGLSTGHGDGAGGIQLQASINNMQLTNNYVENNGGVVAGGIGIGQPYVHGSHNYGVRVANSRLTGNGGLTTSGGLGIFYGSNGYDVAGNVICSNFSVEYGAGISHIGLSPNGKIHDNSIFYNDSVDSGAGLAIETELVVGNSALGAGSGAVDVDRNLIQSNFSGDDGGGIFVLDALKEPINIRSNMIVDNGAADLGGGITLDDATNVRIVNNTVANNVTTASGESSAIGVPRAAGLATEANDPLFQPLLTTHTAAARRTAGSTTITMVNGTSVSADDLGKRVSGTGIQTNSTILAVIPATSTTPAQLIISRTALSSNTTTAGFSLTINAQTFSNPVALFNNIFWDNDAQTLSQFAPGATLVDQGFIDFGIYGTGRNTDTFTPRFSTLTNGLIQEPLGNLAALPPAQSNRVGEDPLFVTPFTLELAVGGSRLDPQQAAVTITGADPPVGLVGDYHLQTTTPAVDRGVRCASTLAAPPPTALNPCPGNAVQAPTLSPALGGVGDYDSQYSPQQRVGARPRTPWDLGADELPGINVTLTNPLP